VLAPHERSDTVIQHKSFNAPDEVRRFPKGILTLVHLGSITMGRAILEPGFRWSTSLKPIQGTPSCQIHHLQLLVQGRFHVEIDHTLRGQPAVGLDVISHAG
jgi:hypothetical protein